MDAWIYVTLLAAFAQTLRFMLQKHLKSTQLSTGGATFARFIYSAPLVVVILLVYARTSTQSIPGIPASFWPYAIMGGVSQILATMCVVALFAHRNFAVGITFKKTEVLLSVLVSFVILGEGVSTAGLGAILVGLLGVLLLSDPPNATGAWRQRVFNRATGLGLTSGLFFGFSGVGYRGASLSLDGGDAFLRALTTLACVTTFQTISLGLWLLWRERGEVMKVLRAWRVASLVGLASMIGSICWFTAFTLQNVGYVNAVGQVELIFSLLATVLVFKEKVTMRELSGVGLLTLSILVLIAVA